MPVQVTNVGNAKVNRAISIQIFASTDGTLTDAVLPGVLTTPALKLLKGATSTYNVVGTVLNGASLTANGVVIF